MKLICCSKCGEILIKINNGEFRKNLKLYCEKCFYNNTDKIDLPVYLQQIFGLNKK